MILSPTSEGSENLLWSGERHTVHGKRSFNALVWTLILVLACQCFLPSFASATELNRADQTERTLSQYRIALAAQMEAAFEVNTTGVTVRTGENLAGGGAAR